MERSLLDSVKRPTECERSHVFSRLDPPAIRFVPEKDVMLENSKTIDVQLRLNNAIQASNFNAVHRKLPIFEGGCLETLLRWKKNLQDTIIGKPCNSPGACFTSLNCSWEETPRLSGRSTQDRSVRQSPLAKRTHSDKQKQPIKQRW